MQIDPFLYPCTKLKSKWIKDLHIKPDTLNRIEEKVGKSLDCMGAVEIFLNRTPMACALRLTIDKWDLIKLKSFCKTKDTVNRTKQQPTDWDKIFTKNRKPMVYAVRSSIHKWDLIKLQSFCYYELQCKYLIWRISDIQSLWKCCSTPKMVLNQFSSSYI
jgi:hypothetical protein